METPLKRMTSGGVAMGLLPSGFCASAIKTWSAFHAIAWFGHGERHR